MTCGSVPLLTMVLEVQGFPNEGLLPARSHTGAPNCLTSPSLELPRASPAQGPMPLDWRTPVTVPPLPLTYMERVGGSDSGALSPLTWY